MIASFREKPLLLAVTIVAAFVVALGLTFRGVTAVGSTQTEGRSIPIQGADAARIEIDMDQGDLRIGQGSSRLLDAAFTFNVDVWQPDLTYQVISREGVLHVEQGDRDGPFSVVYGNPVNSWAMSLTPDIPLDIRVDLGEANGTFVVGGLDLMALSIQGDGGEAMVDLSGTLERDVNVVIRTDGGSASVILPQGVGARLVADPDGGNFSPGGLVPTGSAYVNDLYGQTPVTLTVTVETDGGDVTIAHASEAATAPTPIQHPGR